jgi:NAD(P)-dependent dehydrogenase (short-subunit alcohol dehydrogenase family)
MGLFDGKVAIVTGGSSGIGQATAIAFAQEGADVAFTYHSNRAGGDETLRLIEEQNRKAICVQTDVANAADVQAFVEATVKTFGRVDFAFNNAGIAFRKSLLETTVDEWELVMNTNLKGVWLSMKYELPVMLKQGSGVIVNNASTAGVMFRESQPIYRASKHGVVVLSKSAAATHRRDGIRVNVVCPGFIQTPMIDRGIEQGIATQEWVNSWIQDGLMGEPREIAQAVIWLCSENAAFVTGQAIAVDGGFQVSR